MHRVQQESGIIDENGTQLREKSHGGRASAKDKWNASRGYVKCRAKGHPTADRYGFVLEHRLVMEKKIGRYLESHEIVHHIDGDRKNNNPGNLELLTKGTHHLGHKPSIGSLVGELLTRDEIPDTVKKELEKLIPKSISTLIVQTENS
jgi:hypothetical protein